VSAMSTRASRGGGVRPDPRREDREARPPGTMGDVLGRRSGYETTAASPLGKRGGVRGRIEKAGSGAGARAH
jgi:hypothetical protein